MQTPHVNKANLPRQGQFRVSLEDAHAEIFGEADRLRTNVHFGVARHGQEDPLAVGSHRVEERRFVQGAVPSCLKAEEHSEDENKK